MYHVPVAVGKGKELIDTLWNVNLLISDCRQSLIRINRYIMECKYKTLPCLPEKAPGINRYIMECKFKNQVPVDKEILELIDTLWNVNF